MPVDLSALVPLLANGQDLLLDLLGEAGEAAM